MHQQSRMLRSLGRFLTASTLLVIAVPASSRAPDEEKRDDLLAIREAWKRRESRITSVRFEWELTETITRGFISEGARGEIPNEIIVPPSDVTKEGTALLILDRTRMRYETHGSQWSWDESAFVRQSYVSVFDGNVSLTYWPPHAGHGRATIMKERFNTDLSNYHLMPILFAVRPSLSLSEFLAGPRSPVIKDAFVDKTPCLILENVRSTGKSHRTVWVDPASDYSIIRFTLSTNDVVVLQMDITLENDPKHGWIPGGWRTVERWQKPLPQHLTKAVVKKREMNPALQQEDFLAQFAVGTLAYDMRDETSYLVREGDRKRLITRAERGATYEQLLASESGMALMPPNTGWKLWVAIGVLILTITASVLVWRRYRLARSLRA